MYENWGEKREFIHKCFQSAMIKNQIKNVEIRYKYTLKNIEMDLNMHPYC